jgi:phosphopantetheinyl transferase (holo-ACP synthase)
MPTERSGWTLDTLKEHVESLLASNDRRYEQRFKDSGTAVDAALNAAKEAVLKAETASEKRFEGVNEFRGTLSDQQRTLMPRAEAELRMGAIESQLAALTRIGATRTGEQKGGREVWGYLVGGIGILVAVIEYVTTIMVKK